MKKHLWKRTQLLRRLAAHRLYYIEDLFRARVFYAKLDKIFSAIYHFPMNAVAFPFTVYHGIVGSAPRGFGVPEFISKLSYSAVFFTDFVFTGILLDFELSEYRLNSWKTIAKAIDSCKKLENELSDERLKCSSSSCNSWDLGYCIRTGKEGDMSKFYNFDMCLNDALPVNSVVVDELSNLQWMASNAVYHVQRLREGEVPAECISEAIVENRAELVHLPATMDLDLPLPSKDCPNCDATGVMGCPECKGKFPLRISADNIMDPPWVASDLMRKIDYPYEASLMTFSFSIYLFHIVHSMKDPSIAAFWLITMPQIMGGIDFDDDVKKKIWWQYKESRRYDQLRDVVATREPGWEYLQEALVSIDPDRAREDPVVVKNIPFYKAKNALEAEVMKIDPPPRPQNWGDLDLPLSASSWSKDDLKDPKKLDEMRVLLSAQKEIADQILDTQWQTKWRQDKLNEMLEEKVLPYIQNSGNGSVLPQPIVTSPPPKQDEKTAKALVVLLIDAIKDSELSLWFVCSSRSFFVEVM
ncbi:hypothetical protein LguiA_023102 [Lonicera macranthoides]